MKKVVTIGTAGHIDHGKTSLVRKLTGIDTDRLKEEKERGMTIEPGFAHFFLDDYLISIVDVPGHEKFIKNMVAGAHGIDGVLFVIAADEGVMPQTEEHLAVCEMLGIERGIVVLTKIDTVDEEWLELVEEDVKDFLKGTFLEDAPFVKVSSKTGEGFDILKEELKRLAESIRKQKEESFPRLPVDRVFTVKGFGTVVTGTLSGGRLSKGEVVEILPSKVESKIKNLQTAGADVDVAFPGQRTAANLTVPKEKVHRGNILTLPGILNSSRIVDVTFALSKTATTIEKRIKVHFHYLTLMAEAEIVLIDRDVLNPGERCFAQIIFDREIYPVYGDNFVVRTISPGRVIGGGTILHPLEKKRYRKKFAGVFMKKLKALSGGREDAFLEFVKEMEPLKIELLPQLLNISPDNARHFAQKFEKAGEVVVSDGLVYTAETFGGLVEKALKIVEDYHSRYPVAKGINRETLKSLLNVGDELFLRILSSSGLEEERKVIRQKGFVPHLDEKFLNLKEKLDSELRKGGFSAPSLDNLREKLNISSEDFYTLLSFLKKEGYKTAGEFLLSPEVYRKIERRTVDLLKQKGEITVGDFKELFNLSRKHAIPYLELLDAEGVTVRDSSGKRKLNV
ncbi:selenocysteine-specific translation elongation factor [Desulfurobacterium indicum]|uniref:Selenocysteine-specific translation elongation factor n=1 Tax=Desulfurobacterium indicum TaxID=1914305 RepID=A0A1R1MNX4_9BACT|nr:selenocysteine-specific translation elongation factor [Desulfurobacterium indicum]OMH41394.1 selenocysteine-specific translation elongation factor [Desulfurobacterium indicum]